MGFPFNKKKRLLDKKEGWIRHERERERKRERERERERERREREIEREREKVIDRYIDI